MDFTKSAVGLEMGSDIKGSTKIKSNSFLLKLVKTVEGRQDPRSHSKASMSLPPRTNVANFDRLVSKDGQTANGHTQKRGPVALAGKGK